MVGDCFYETITAITPSRTRPRTSTSTGRFLAAPGPSIYIGKPYRPCAAHSPPLRCSGSACSRRPMNGCGTPPPAGQPSVWRARRARPSPAGTADRAGTRPAYPAARNTGTHAPQQMRTGPKVQRLGKTPLRSRPGSRRSDRSSPSSPGRTAAAAAHNGRTPLWYTAAPCGAARCRSRSARRGESAAPGCRIPPTARRTPCPRCRGSSEPSRKRMSGNARQQAAQQIDKRHPRRQVLAVGGDLDAGQHDLVHARRLQLRGLQFRLLRRQRAHAPARVRYNAIGTEVVAPILDLEQRAGAPLRHARRQDFKRTVRFPAPSPAPAGR